MTSTMPVGLAIGRKRVTHRIWLLTAVLLLAFGLRMHRLADDSIWWDEGFSVWMARQPIGEMLFQTANDAHPPLSYALLHAWRGLVGDEELALRALSVFCGLLTVAIGFQIGRELGGSSVGLAGALLTAVARLPVWWSQEVRMYAPAALFAALATWAALRLLMEKQHPWHWAAMLALGLGAGLLTLYLFGGVIVALNLAWAIALLIARKRRQLIAIWAAAQGGALALFLPWAFYAYRYLPSWETPQAPVDLWFVIKLYLSTVFLGIASDIEQYAALLVSALIALVGAGLVSLMTASRSQRAGWATLLMGVILPPFLVYLLSLPRGRFNYPTPSPRYFLLLSTLAYVLLGWGAIALAHRKLILQRLAGFGLLAGFIGASAWSLGQYYNGLRLSDDYISLAATLEALRRPTDAVILNNDTDWPIFAYHYPATFERHISHTQPIRDDKYAAGLLSYYRENKDGVWLVQTPYAEVTDPNNILGQWLRQRAWNWRTYVFPEGQLWFYAMNPERADPNTVDRASGWPHAMLPVDAPIAEGVRLVGYVQPLHEVPAGSLLVVGLGWHVEEGVTGGWPVAVKLIDTEGREVASTLVPLSGLGEEDRYLPVELFVPPDASDGWAQIVFVAGQTWQPLNKLYIRAKTGQTAPSSTVPESARPLNVRFGQGITLLAADLPDRLEWEPGAGIPLTLYWQAQQPIPERYKVFVHLVGSTYNPATNNSIWGQQDQEPRGGASVTTSWRPGQVIADDYLVPVWEDAPPGKYVLEVGLYLPIDGQRLPAFDEDGIPIGDAITLLEIEVVR